MSPSPLSDAGRRRRRRRRRGSRRLCRVSISLLLLACCCRVDRAAGAFSPWLPPAIGDASPSRVSSATGRRPGAAASSSSSSRKKSRSTAAAAVAASPGNGGITEGDPFGDFEDFDDDFGSYSYGGGGGGGGDTEDDTRRRPQRQDGAAPFPKSHFFSRKSLDDPSFFSLPGEEDEDQQEETASAFRRMCVAVGVTRPSKIQALAWPILLSGSNALVADQTGSGKTLAYLIPLLLRCRHYKRNLSRRRSSGGADNEEEGRGGSNSRGGARPLLLVLAPTAELADQTRTVCRRLAKSAGSLQGGVLALTASGRFSTDVREQVRMLKSRRQNPDVIVSTPGRLSTLLRTKGALDLSHLRAIVLDEVDVLMMDETFGPQLRTVGAAASVDKTQFVFCTATLPERIADTVRGEFPDIREIRGPGLHRVAPTVAERLVDVSVPAAYHRNADYCFQAKADKLLAALRETRCSRTLVFCNTVGTCRQVENLLKRKDRRENLYRVGAYHGAMTPESRNENLREFSSSRGGSGRGESGGDDVNRILVCTDRAARGVDFDASPVDHVVVFDFPKDPAEYVRRVGRTARAGRGGTATVLAYGWQLPIARSVMAADGGGDATGGGWSANNNTSRRRLDGSSSAGMLLDDDEDSEDAEYYGEAARRRRDKGAAAPRKGPTARGKRKRKSDYDIKDNIEGGKLWGRS